MRGKLPTFILAVAMLVANLVSSRARWELIPLGPTADPTTFNSTNHDPAIWNVTKLEDLPEVANRDTSEFPDPDYGNTIGFCVGTDTDGDCCIAIRIPSAPRLGYALMDSWIYTQKCERIRGYYLHQTRNTWASIYSDLPWTTDVHDNANSWPHFKYSSVDCNGFWCSGWTYVFDDPDVNGYSVMVYRNTWACSGDD